MSRGRVAGISCWRDAWVSSRSYGGSVGKLVEAGEVNGEEEFGGERGQGDVEPCVEVVGIADEEGCLATCDVCGGRAGGEDMDVHRRLILPLLEHVRRDIRA